MERKEKGVQERHQKTGEEKRINWTGNTREGRRSPYKRGYFKDKPAPDHYFFLPFAFIFLDIHENMMK